MWPFDRGVQGLWLALYVATFALHAVFVGYVVCGTAYALVQAVRRRQDAFADRVRDRLPFMLGLGITAGVAPLLFLQLLYQRHFYSANLIAGPRWGAVVPALIAGFYALYLAKARASERWRRVALAAALGCFGFVAWSWTELHLLMRDEPAWHAMYAAGQRFYGDAAVLPRLVLWLGWMATLFATVALWSANTPWVERRRLAILALVGRAISGAAIAWLVLGGAAIDPAHGWLYLLAGAVGVELIGWASMLRTPDGLGPTLATAGVTAALIAGVVVREAPRLALLEPPREAAAGAGGLALFLVTFVIGVIAIRWVVRTVRSA
jgi:hypothetical protein